MKLWQRKKDDFYITFLKYAHEKISIGEGTIEFADAFEHVHSIHGDVSEQVFRRIFLLAVATIEFPRRELLPEDIVPGRGMVLTTEAYFQLLEHQELQEARKASSTAQMMASGAIAIAVASLIISVIFQVFGTTDAVIDGTQYQGIIDAIQDK